MAKPINNNPNQAGQLAGRKELFGDYKRYAVAPVHTRCDTPRPKGLGFFAKTNPVGSHHATARTASGT